MGTGVALEPVEETKFQYCLQPEEDVAAVHRFGALEVDPEVTGVPEGNGGHHGCLVGVAGVFFSVVGFFWSFPRNLEICEITASHSVRILKHRRPPSSSIYFCE